MHHEPGPGDENNWWDRTSVYSSWLGASDEKLFKNWIKQINLVKNGNLYNKIWKLYNTHRSGNILFISVPSLMHDLNLLNGIQIKKVLNNLL
jgi:hypothetical protein